MPTSIGNKMFESFGGISILLSTLGIDFLFFFQVRGGAEESLAWGVTFDFDFVEADHA